MRTRRVRVFSWSDVPDDILRALLRTTKRKFTPSGDVSNIDRWQREQLVVSARAVFGEPPPLAVEKPFVSVLLDMWVSQLDGDNPALTRLALLSLGTQPMRKRVKGAPATRKG